MLRFEFQGDSVRFPRGRGRGRAGSARSSSGASTPSTRSSPAAARSELGGARFSTLASSCAARQRGISCVDRLLPLAACGSRTPRLARVELHDRRSRARGRSPAGRRASDAARAGGRCRRAASGGRGSAAGTARRACSGGRADRLREDRKAHLPERLGEQRRADRLGRDAAAEVERVLLQPRRDQVEREEIAGQVEEVAPVVRVADPGEDVVDDDLAVFGAQSDGPADPDVEVDVLDERRDDDALRRREPRRSGTSPRARTAAASRGASPGSRRSSASPM